MRPFGHHGPRPPTVATAFAVLDQAMIAREFTMHLHGT
jgi:hypothetical protein